jgi:hypothetical protein
MRHTHGDFLYMVKLRRNVETVIENGRELVQVSVNGKGDRTVELWKNDYDFLIHKLKLNPNWTTAYNRKNVLALAITNSKVSVARCLLDADIGQIVRYKDSNPMNLRRENLLLMNGDKRAGKRRDRNFIRYAMSIEEKPHVQ